MSKKGRPDVYYSHVEPYLDQIPEWYKTMSVRQIAAKLGVSKTSLYKYAKEHEELQQALDESKSNLVEDLRSTVKRKALGYTYDETTVKETKAIDADSGELIVTERITTTVTKHQPPDLGSLHLLLKNLDPEWHNDDMTTIKLRKREVAIKEKRAEAEDW